MGHSVCSNVDSRSYMPYWTDFIRHALRDPEKLFLSTLRTLYDTPKSGLQPRPQSHADSQNASRTGPPQP